MFKIEGFFDAQDTLSCGQIFRFYEKDGIFYVFSKGEYAKIHGDEVVSTDDGYFGRFFDILNDYGPIYQRAKSFKIDVLDEAAEFGKGIRILNQDPEEMIISFIVSQNNNIPRIKGIIERLSESLGEQKEFDGLKYFAFPTTEALADKDAEFYLKAGCGYRASYLSDTAKKLLDTDLGALKKLETPKLKEELLKFKGIGPKVADCIALFGFHRTDSFPVDTWIDRLYREDFNGTVKDRGKINEYFTGLFGGYSGYIQQYLFYYKRELSKLK